ncbi:Inositol phosphosphingolipids phospholipase C [Trichoderma ghanense]|uniref:Inositol phosphosphingolipids phospholipase C n=1 Tax=Trichoderma ghanense TaxID=65468 RepID=A0ABY2GSC7_9HYPO
MDPSASQTTNNNPPVTQIRLLTLNCWGLVYISALRTPRLAEIGRQLALLDPPPDIVCLQECWAQADYRAVREATAAVLPHGKFYHSGAFGGGLAVLSRWPIEASSMFRYPLNGRPTAFWRGDWYVGKGVACASVRFGPGKNDVIEVFNTHTHAPYERPPNDTYLCHRTAQAWEISKLLRAASLTGRLVVALGDFNMTPRSLTHRIITARTPLRDTWRVLHPESSLGTANDPVEKARGLPVPTAHFNLTVNGSTSDGVYNTWRWTKAAREKLKTDPCPVDPDSPDPRGKRLDYVFASTGPFPPDARNPSAPPRGWVVHSASVEMTQRHPELNVSLSDHFAAMATLKFHEISPSSPDPVLDAQLLDPPPDKEDPESASLSLSDYDEILAMTHEYMAREVRQRYWRAIHFYASVLVWIGCLVAVWFSPRNFVAFILMLVASLGLTTGVVDGLLALLFFWSEIRALREFEWEIQTARALASSEHIDSEIPAAKADLLAVI